MIPVKWDVGSGRRWTGFDPEQMSVRPRRHSEADGLRSDQKALVPGRPAHGALIEVIPTPLHGLMGRQKLGAIFKMHRVEVIPLTPPNESVTFKYIYDFERYIIPVLYQIACRCRPSPVVRIFRIDIDSRTISMHAALLRSYNGSATICSSAWNEISYQRGRQFFKVVDHCFQLVCNAVNSSNHDDAPVVRWHPLNRAHPRHYFPFFAIAIHLGEKGFITDSPRILIQCWRRFGRSSHIRQLEHIFYIGPFEQSRKVFLWFSIRNRHTVPILPHEIISFDSLDEIGVRGNKQCSVGRIRYGFREGSRYRRRGCADCDGHENRAHTDGSLAQAKAWGSICLCGHRADRLPGAKRREAVDSKLSHLCCFCGKQGYSNRWSRLAIRYSRPLATVIWLMSAARLVVKIKEKSPANFARFQRVSVAAAGTKRQIPTTSGKRPQLDKKLQSIGRVS